MRWHLSVFLRYLLACLLFHLWLLLWIAIAAKDVATVLMVLCELFLHLEMRTVMWLYAAVEVFVRSGEISSGLIVVIVS